MAVLWADYSSTAPKLPQYKTKITPVLHRSTPSAPLQSFVEKWLGSHSLSLCRTPVSLRWAFCLVVLVSLSCWAGFCRLLLCSDAFVAVSPLSLHSLVFLFPSPRGGLGRGLYNNVYRLLFVNIVENLHFFFKKTWEMFGGYW